MTEMEIASLKIGDTFSESIYFWTVITKDEYILARGKDDYWLKNLGPEPIFLRCDRGLMYITYIDQNKNVSTYLEQPCTFYRAFKNRQELTELYLATGATKH